ncbi:hypothetical protein WAI453_001866 [Rhynchosporium graminicola]
MRFATLLWSLSWQSGPSAVAMPARKVETCNDDDFGRICQAKNPLGIGKCSGNTCVSRLLIAMDNLQ